MTSTDAEFIAASGRDPEQFAVLFDRHAPHIHRYLARRVGPQAADGLVGETFLAAFGQCGRYDSRYPDARPWLYGIATNLLRQFYRQEVRRLRLLKAASPERLTVPDYSERTVASVAAQTARPGLRERSPSCLAVTATSCCWSPGRTCPTRRSPARSRSRRHGAVPAEPCPDQAT